MEDEELLSDPLLGPLVKKLATAEERVKAHEARLTAHEDTWLRGQYAAQLTTLGKRWNDRFNADGKGKPFDQKSFLDFVLQRRTPDLELAYDSFSFEDERALAVRE